MSQQPHHPTLREVPGDLDQQLPDVPARPDGGGAPQVPDRSASVFDSLPMDLDPLRLRAERLARTRAMLREQELDAVLLFDPYNQRYATGSRNMFGYFLRNATRYLYIPREGDVILFEYPGSAHVSTWLETIQESRTSKVVWASVNGRDRDAARPFAEEIAELVARDAGGPAGGRRRVALDRCTLGLARALEAEGLEVEDCMQAMLHARRLKTADEVACLSLSMSAVEAAVHGVERMIAPGVSETELFAKLYEGALLGGCEFIETRLLSSGPKTNPWFNEAGERRVRPGELVALDSDTIGVNSYYADMSRTFFCGPGRPSGTQRSLYSMAWEQIHHNAALLRPGLAFRELAERAWPIPERFFDQRYPSIIHGVGMHGEKPLVAHLCDLDRYTGDGVLEAGMVVSVESYVGEPGAADGVKLEDQYLITETGAARMTRYPFDEALLDRQV